jgi:hypothetical protein
MIIHDAQLLRIWINYPNKKLDYPLVISQFAMERSTILKFGKPSISIRAMASMVHGEM